MRQLLLTLRFKCIFFSQCISTIANLKVLQLAETYFICLTWPRICIVVLFKLQSITTTLSLRLDEEAPNKHYIHSCMTKSINSSDYKIKSNYIIKSINSDFPLPILVTSIGSSFNCMKVLFILYVIVT